MTLPLVGSFKLTGKDKAFKMMAAWEASFSIFPA